MPFYRIILKKALSLTWKNKRLWFLGLFAAFIGNGSVYEALLRSFNNMSEGQSIFDTVREYSQMGVWGMFSMAKFKSLWETDASSFSMFLFGILAFLAVVAIIISLGVICQGGLIKSAVRLDQGQKVSFRESLRIGVDHFWSILEVNVITKIILLGLLMLLAYGVSMILFSNYAVNGFIYILSFCIFILFGIVIYFLTIYSTAYIVLRGKGTFAAIKSAWKIFRKHFLLNLEMGLLLFILNILLTLAFFFCVFILIAPFLILYFLCLFAGVNWGIGIFSMIVVVAFVSTLLIFGAAFAAFQLSAWALLFEELEIKGGKSKTLRVYEGIRVRLKRK